MGYIPWQTIRLDPFPEWYGKGVVIEDRRSEWGRVLDRAPGAELDGIMPCLARLQDPYPYELACTESLRMDRGCR